MMATLTKEPLQPDMPTGSPLALSGLLMGIGVLDAVEVLRYLDSTFRAAPLPETDRQSPPKPRSLT